MRISQFGLIAPLLAGCAISAPVEEQQTESITASPVPRKSGKFKGHYVVPAPANLTEAAIFTVPEVEWTVARGIATLEYDLPVGLVGGELSVTLRGPIRAGATSVQLSSNFGTGTCTAQGPKVRCSELLTNLGTLPISEAIIEQVAAVEYPGPASDRAQVAAFFSSDPIGTVDFDVTKPSDDDDDDDDEDDDDDDDDDDHGGGGGPGPH
jgi:hypothetical protein